MDGRTDGQMNRWTDELIGRCLDGWIFRWTIQITEQMVNLVNGWKFGHMDD